MPKATTPTASRQGRRHNPLEDDVVSTGILRNNKPGKRRSKHSGDNENGGNDGDHFVDSKASRNILRIGRELAAEDDAQIAEQRQQGVSKPSTDSFGYDSRFDDDDDDDDEQDKVYGDGDDEAWGGDDDEVVEEIEVEPEDLETYRRFMPDDEDELLKHGWDRRPAEGEEVNDDEEPVNLADLILEKIAVHEATAARRAAGVPEPVEDDYELPPKVVEAYTKIGQILSRYKSGPLPKPFKILPTIPHWEEIIEVTQPDSWTPNAVYQATRIFVSSKPHVVQRFLEMVVLEKVREDIHENKKLNVHLFNSLKKALYKPAAFFKGFLFPLVGSGSCTLREAHIISAVLSRVSVPVLHSAAALKGLCDIAAQEASQGTEGGGATNIFIRTLLEKKYALPYQVIDALVFHFLRFRSVDPASVKHADAMSGALANPGDARAKLPVIWHQSLLAFAQRYKGDITEDQREALLDLLLTHGHLSIGPEVRRELIEGRGRGIPMETEGVALDGDDTISFGFGLSTLTFPPYPVAYYNAPAVQHDDLIQHQMWNELSWGKASDDGDEDRRRSGFFDGAISFPPPSSSVDPPRPARVGFEWVWFPEGYWAERQTPAVRPRRRHASSISSRLSGRRKATVQSADNDAPKPESPKTPYLSETDLVVSLQNPSPENPGRSWRRGSGFRMSEPEATVHSTPSDQESEGSPGKHRSRSKKAAKFMRDVLTIPISSRRNSKLSYKQRSRALRRFLKLNVTQSSGTLQEMQQRSYVFPERLSESPRGTEKGHLVR
ncbi:essential nuclear protein 1 [Geosmithia morbida]|uniref:Essential nuclear protein 1 n=1 Tax=Geosmithia morbida TaxID=1094350 RepID=A0A9P5D3S5_9HYPO|nr:essential nuclear protein 1 [Geosmithia morbida]KAF4126528.1 essential nuclear protein 1 [Geosmithia morbida]